MNEQTYSPCPNCRKLNRVPLSDASGPSAKKPVCGACKTELRVHDGVSELGASDLLALIEKSPLPVVVDFWAPWCGPCRAFAPTFKQAARQFAGRAVFAKVDTQAHPLAGSTYNIRSIPTLILFNGGFERSRQMGALPPQHLAQWIEALAAKPAA